MHDLINSLFGFGSAIALFANVMQIYKDKGSKGVNFTTMGYFVVQGSWTTYFYFHLDQMFSFVSMASILLCNIMYFWLMIYYRFIKK